MYAVTADLKGQIPSDFLDQLTDDGDSIAQVANLAATLKDASDWVDGYLARFNPPIVDGVNGTQVTLDCLRVHTIVRIKHVLLARKSGPEGYRNTDEDFQATKAFLMAIQKGAPLPGAFEPTPAETALVTGSVTAGEIVWDDDSAVL
jgi:phage gp36-like protein